jgi:hypothetical protein
LLNRGETGKPRKYIKEHYHGFKKRDAHMNWKGGRTVDKKGYILILKPDHPFCNAMGYIREHRLVYEDYHKCCLLYWVMIHHINGIKDDNRIENLHATTISDHMILHKTGIFKDMSDRYCKRCGTTKTSKYEGKYDLWRRHPLTKEEWYCNSCGTIILNQLKKED